MSEPVLTDLPGEPSFDDAVKAAMSVMPTAPVAQETAAAAPEAVAVAPTAEPAPAAVPPPDLRVGELEAQLRDAHAKLAEAEGRPATDWSAFESDPLGTIKRVNPSLTPAQAAKVAEHLYFYALGDQAPAEFRMRQEMAAKVDPKVAELEAKIAQLTTAQAEKDRAAQIAAYQGELRSHGAQLAADKFPVLSALAKRDPDAFTEVLYGIAVQEAHDSHRRGDKVPSVLSPSMAAERAEKLLVAQRDRLYGPPAATAPSPAPAAVSAPSLFSRDVSAQPSRTTPDPLDNKALRAAALKAAGIDIPVWD